MLWFDCIKYIIYWMFGRYLYSSFLHLFIFSLWLLLLLMYLSLMSTFSVMYSIFILSIYDLICILLHPIDQFFHSNYFQMNKWINFLWIAWICNVTLGNSWQSDIRWPPCFDWLMLSGVSPLYQYFRDVILSDAICAVLLMTLSLNRLDVFWYPFCIP